MQSHKAVPRLVWVVPVLFLLFISIPYLYAFRVSDPTHVFAGFLLNPLDGTTYLAKMYQGYRGDWLFTLPYTAEVGQGSLLNFHYILLGHLARLSGLPLLAVYHLARLVGAIALLAAMDSFFKACFPEQPGQSRLAFGLAALGSGMGWLLVPWGIVSADFWVAEAFPLLSAYTNPHFPISLALLLLIFGAFLRQSRQYVWLGLAAFFLGAISPFGIAIALLVMLGYLAWDLLLDRRQGTGWTRLLRDLPRRGGVPQSLVVALAGTPMVLYALVITRLDPLLAGWNVQNLTLSPPVWDVFLALSPLLVLALFGVGWGLRRAGGAGRLRLVIIWFLAGMLLLYVPFGLQRRMMMGIYLPLAALAAVSLTQVGAQTRRSPSWWGSLTLVLSAPTILLVFFAALSGIRSYDLKLYLTQDEVQAMRWLEQHSDQAAVILASPDTGLLIPAHTGRRVVYGHPFETVDAANQRQLVERFFRATTPGEALGQLELIQAQVKIDFIFYGPREAQLGDLPLRNQLVPVFQSGQVSIYQPGP